MKKIFIIATRSSSSNNLKWRRLTVDGDGNALAQDVAVGALEGRDLAELVEQAVVIADALGGLGVDLLDLEVVGLGDGEDGRRARVAL